MSQHLKHKLYNLLPTGYALPKHIITKRTLITSFGLQRSGQHLIIEWICRGLPNDTLHLNHCRFHPTKGINMLMPMRGRSILYNAKGIQDSGVQQREYLHSNLPPRNSRQPLLFYRRYRPGNPPLQAVAQKIQPPYTDHPA